MIYSAVILIWQFGEFPKGLQIKCKPFIMQTWACIHKVLKTVNLQYCQWFFLSKLPNISLTNSSIYMVHTT